jgi:hypothetical protein
MAQKKTRPKTTAAPAPPVPDVPLNPLCVTADQCREMASAIAGASGDRVIVIVVNEAGAFQVRSDLPPLAVIATLHRASIQIHLSLG